AILPTGGMGELYKVRHVHLGDFRVVKIRKPSAREDDTGTKRFIREAKLAATIKHPNLASLFDFAQLDDGSFYMVNEYVDGMTVAEHIRAGGRFEIAQVLRIAEQALLALETIHAAGIVHRDVASDNVMLTQTSSGETVVKIIDLGIAKALDGEGLTSTGFFVGKARYASPEQVNTQDPEPIDQRSDLYSLGIVLYEMVSGDVPFAGSTPAASVIKRLTSDITQVPPRDASIVIDTNVEGIILRLLRREREERFPSAADALREVRKQIAARPNYDSEGTLSRITRDRELYRLAGVPEPPKREGTAEISIAELEAERIAAEAASKPVRKGTVEMSLDDLAAEDAQELPTVPKTAAAGEPIERTEALPLMSRDLRDQLMAGAQASQPPAPQPPVPSKPPAPPPEELAETMPFQKWQQSQAPTIASPVPAHPTRVDQEEIQTVVTDQRPAYVAPPGPVPPPPVVPPPPAPAPPPAPRPAAAPPPAPRPAAAPAPVPAKPPSGMRAKTIVIIAVVALFALAALSVAGYAAWKLYGRFVSAPTAPVTAAPTATATADTATTTTAEAEIIETSSAPAPGTAADIAPATDTTPTDSTATTTQAPVEPAPSTAPPKPVKKRVKAPPPPAPPPPTESVEPEPEPVPAVKEGDLVELGPGVVDAKLIVKQPLRLSVKDRLKGTRGSATIGFIVSPDGVPEQMEVLESSGDETIDKAALRAAAASRYVPATKDGVTVRVRAALEFTNEKQ
ncbi:MAG: TonB family protein, partial [Thermoanaerobaculia bacterium]|nr:TonB family protein [Thermoanaerobaculia bacterium]